MNLHQQRKIKNSANILKIESTKQRQSKKCKVLQIQNQVDSTHVSIQGILFLPNPIKRANPQKLSCRLALLNFQNAFFISSRIQLLHLISGTWHTEPGIGLHFHELENRWFRNRLPFFSELQLYLHKLRQLLQQP